MGLEGGRMLIGTVPIRRTIRDNLIRAKLRSQMYAPKINDIQSGTYVSYNFIIITK